MALWRLGADAGLPIPTFLPIACLHSFPEAMPAKTRPFQGSPGIIHRLVLVRPTSMRQRQQGARIRPRLTRIRRETEGAPGCFYLITGRPRLGVAWTLAARMGGEMDRDALHS